MRLVASSVNLLSQASMRSRFQLSSAKAALYSAVFRTSSSDGRVYEDIIDGSFCCLCCC